jgi:NAD(P)-dependent dehydrogenase (short-subunit alcohol dehydrogenase family)
MATEARAVLVTGGTGALGQAVVAELLSSGVRVVSTWIVAEERDRLRTQIADDRLAMVQADLSSAAGAEAAVAEAAKTTGEPIGGLVNLVGGFAAGPRTHEADPADLERMLQLNLMTAYFCSRAALGGMVERGGGSIVCIGTKTALEPFSGGLAYSVSKAAVIAMVRALAVEYREDGIRANAVLPNVIDTPANRASMPDADHSTWVPPAEIARVIAFLCSEDSAPVSGTAVPVYGRAG